MTMMMMMIMMMMMMHIHYLNICLNQFLTSNWNPCPPTQQQPGLQHQRQNVIHHHLQTSVDANGSGWVRLLKLTYQQGCY